MHKLVRDNLESFVRYTREHYRRPLPRYVQREFRRYIDCGVLAKGFTRLLCRRCGKDMLVAFSCKTRGICSACGARRMAQTAVHLCDRVLPDVPVRQWVVSFPYELRALLASNATVLSAVVRIVMTTVLGYYAQRARQLGCKRPQSGAVSVVQRAGGSVNLNCHVHAIVVDGVYECEQHGDAAVFRFVSAPSQHDIGTVAGSICERVCKMLRRRRMLADPDHASNETPAPHEAIDGCRAAALLRGRFERIDAAGVSQQELFDDEALELEHPQKSRWVGRAQGFSVHAGVSFGALERKGREKLVRYCLRPSIATERLSLLRDGSVAYRIKHPRPGRKAATHRVMQPLELMARLAAIVPPPRAPLMRYHGCLAPASRRRGHIAPRRQVLPRCMHAPKQPTAAQTAETHRHAPQAAGATNEGSKSCEAPTTDVCASVLASVLGVPAAPLPQASERKLPRRSTSYVDWATLMARTFGLDVLQCDCGAGRFEPIAVITNPQTTEKILGHLRLPLRAETLTDGRSVGYDVTGEPIPTWAVGTDPEPGLEAEEQARGPPSDCDGIDPPAPED